jgi:hypothetical protein
MNEHEHEMKLGRSNTHTHTHTRKVINGELLRELILYETLGVVVYYYPVCLLLSFSNKDRIAKAFIAMFFQATFFSRVIVTATTASCHAMPCHASCTYPHKYCTANTL